MQKKGLNQKSFKFKSGEIKDSIDVDKETNVEKEERTFLIHWSVKAVLTSHLQRAHLLAPKWKKGKIRNIRKYIEIELQRYKPTKCRKSELKTFYENHKFKYSQSLFLSLKKDKMISFDTIFFINLCDFYFLSCS